MNEARSSSYLRGRPVERAKDRIVDICVTGYGRPSHAGTHRTIGEEAT